MPVSLPTGINTKCRTHHISASLPTQWCRPKLLITAACMPTPLFLRTFSQPSFPKYMCKTYSLQAMPCSSCLPLKLLWTSFNRNASISAMASLSRLKTLKQTANWKELHRNVQFNIPEVSRSFAACSNFGLPSDNDCQILPSLRPLGESSTRSMRKNGARIGGSELGRWPACLQVRGKGPQRNNLNFARFQSSQCASAVPRERVECVVVGAGVVGLAVARELALEGREVWVIEGATDVGTGTSSRNSEVIHAGLHYPQGSLKAKLCVEGKDAMYAYCQENGVPFKKAGKLIVATQSQQVPVLEKMLRAGEANGVNDLRILEATDVRSMEPQLQCVKALWSPSSGILDTHSFMSTLEADAEEHGASFAFNTSMLRGVVTKRNIELHVGSTEALTPSSGKGVDAILCANYVVNATGLYAQSFARNLDGLAADSIPASHFARGCYFSLSGVKSPFSHLIYPIPEDGGLGCHVTLDLGGQIRFGPEVEWLPELMNSVSLSTQFDYSVDPKRADRFYSEIRKYYPSLPDGALQPNYSGIRPKISGPGQPSADFLIQGERDHGVRGLVNLYGIESPGLTSCLAIAKLVHAMLMNHEC